ncbi:hypothetical protein [Streptomyces stelliscabiei]|uniref:hypothetical protein n=1 Tax=Streptomyces stelliscabiei TaxID=146820 RepID=UPI002FF23DCB
MTEPDGTPPPPTPPVESSGRRSLAVGGDLGIGITGDNNTVHQYLVIGGSHRTDAENVGLDQPPL